jgi:hypothetical protein
MAGNKVNLIASVIMASPFDIVALAIYAAQV